MPGRVRKSQTECTYRTHLAVTSTHPDHAHHKDHIMTTLLILNRQPYDSTDVTWNALRLTSKLRENAHEVTLFLMNDAVDLARDSCRKPESYDQDLVAMVKTLIADGVSVKVCGTCMARCGLYKNEPYYTGAERSTMTELATLVTSSDKVLTF
jgi:uncharacterized protein involved in oxidation of intracellular sulfur